MCIIEREENVEETNRCVSAVSLREINNYINKYIIKQQLSNDS